MAAKKSPANNIQETLQEAHDEILNVFLATQGIQKNFYIKKMCHPPEWRYRSRPSYMFGHILSLPDALEECGKTVFGDDWIGTPDKPYEWHARSEDMIKCWNDFSEQTRYTVVMGDIQDGIPVTHILQKVIDFSDTPQKEVEAFNRKEIVYKKLIEWLNTGSIQTFTLNENGTRNNIAPNEWLRSGIFAVFESGRISGKPNAEYFPINRDIEAVWIDRAEFSKVLETLLEDKRSKNVPSSNKGRTPQYDWTTFHAELTRKIHDEGLPETQAELEKHMAEWCSNTWGKEPSESMIRDKVSPSFNAVKEADK